jgi:hypothetical protein
MKMRRVDNSHSPHLDALLLIIKLQVSIDLPRCHADGISRAAGSLKANSKVRPSELYYCLRSQAAGVVISHSCHRIPTLKHDSAGTSSTHGLGSAMLSFKPKRRRDRHTRVYLYPIIPPYMNLLIPAFALLIAACTEVATSHLTLYYAILVLDLSWIVTFNAFVLHITHHR